MKIHELSTRKLGGLKNDRNYLDLRKLVAMATNIQLNIYSDVAMDGTGTLGNSVQFQCFNVLVCT